MIADLSAPAFALPAWTQDWLLTYLLHSTILLAGLGLLTHLARRLPAAWQETLWRTALLGGLLTATVQVALGYESVGGRVELAVAPAPVVAPAEVAHARRELAEPPIEAVPAVEPSGAPLSFSNDDDRGAAAATQPAALPPSRATVPSLAHVLAALWAAGVLVAIVRLARARRRLGTRIAGRAALPEGALHAMLQRLDPAGGRSSVALTRSERLQCPVALGILRPEICLPARAVDELTPAQQEAMLAHELAHHRRHDPLWLAVGHWLEALLFFQPLNLVAVRRLRSTSEILCDAWAVERTGSRRALAECLARVAEWMLHSRQVLPASAMAQGGAGLERRVRRLLDGTPESPRRRGRTLLACLPLLLVAVLAPGVGRAATSAPAGPAAASRPAPHDPVAPAGDLPAALDEEIAALSAELAVLLDLLARAESPPPALHGGVERIQERLAALAAGRAALHERVSLTLESKR